MQIPNALKRALSRWLFLTSISACLAVSATLAKANSNPVELCEIAASTASRQIGVPLSIMQAISRTETGRSRGGRVEPWAWTVNMEGKGIWFDTQNEARAYVSKHFARGARSFDIGCFQINHKWHGHAFDSIDSMFDPETNALYAARFLKDLFKELGNWSAAAGAYHSRKPVYAKRYRARFDRILADMPNSNTAGIVRTAAQLQVRQNSFPLLQPAGGAARMGSLVPNGVTPRSSLFAAPQHGG